MNPSKAIKRLTIKGYDSAVYFYNRFLIYCYFYRNILRRKFVLGERVDKILVVRLASIGDVVRATAIVKSLNQLYPRARIDFLTTGAALPVLKGNPRLHSIYTLADLHSLPAYDWIINLQRAQVPPSFLGEIDLTFEDILKHLSLNVSHKLITGRHFQRGRDRSHVNIFDCRTEMEELFINALLPYSHERITDTEITLPNKLNCVLKRFSVLPEGNYLGIFLGSNSAGGDDQGQRTYSIEFVEKLANLFSPSMKVVIVGESHHKSPEEKTRYKAFLEEHPEIIDLVDKTNLEELVCVISGFRLLISCDSGPLHIAMALGVPVIGLYVNAARFRMAPQLRGERYVLIDGFDVCFDYSWRWKFHCLACQDKHSKMYACNLKTIDHKVDKIPIKQIIAAAYQLMNGPIAGGRTDTSAQNSEGLFPG